LLANVAQEIAHLPDKHKTLSLAPSTTKKIEVNFMVKLGRWIGISQGKRGKEKRRIGRKEKIKEGC
jgi:hypothetical protein